MNYEAKKPAEKEEKKMPSKESALCWALFLCAPESARLELMELPATVL